jgi:hypothetical protein
MSDTPRTDKAMRTLDDDGDSTFGYAFARQLERELNQAKQKLDEWENAIKFVEDPPCDEQHCGCVEVLRGLLGKAIKERDEAREHLGTAAYMYASYMEEHLGGVTPGEAKMIDRWRKAAGLEETK